MLVFFLPRVESHLRVSSTERESFRARAWPLPADIPTIASSKEARGQVHSSGRTRRLVCFMPHIAVLETDFVEATTS